MERQLLNLLLTHSKKEQLDVIANSHKDKIQVRDVAVLGAAGAMGRLFARHLAEQGHELRIYDPDQDEAKAVSNETGATLQLSLHAAVEGADTVLVAVPLEKTPQVVEEVVDHADGGTTIAEISSIKRPVIEPLRRAASTGCAPLSLHPLFGPGALSPRGRRIAVVPIAEEEAELSSGEELFPTAELFPVEAEEHDSAIALTVGVVYFLNMAFASLLSGQDLPKLRRLGGTTFDTQLLLASALFNQRSDTYVTVLKESDHLKDLLQELSRNISTWIDDGDFTATFRQMREYLRDEASFSQAYETLYRIHGHLDYAP